MYNKSVYITILHMLMFTVVMHSLMLFPANCRSTREKLKLISVTSL